MTDSRTDSFSPSILLSSGNLSILRDFNCHYPHWDSKGTSDPRRKNSIGSSPLIIVLLMTPTSQLLSIAPLFTSPLLPLLLHQDGASGPGFRSPTNFTNCPSFSPLLPQRTTHFLQFQKVRWNDFVFYFDSHCPSAEEYSSLPLSSAAALFTSLALNATNFPVLSAASNANLKLGCLLKWKKR